jgi:ABC-type branched-subunit amino acid transport system substrate-binding protein
MKKVLKLVALLAALTLVAAACGSSDSDTTVATSPDTTAAAGATTTTTTAGPTGPLTDFGVTEAPCDDAVNAGNGCIYLGVISDLSTGPFSALAIPAVGGLNAFWADVNAAGGVDGFDVIINESNTVDAHYNPQETVEGYTKIEPDILMLAQSLGTPQTQAALSRYVEDSMVAVPATWWSGWAFDEFDGNGLIVEAGVSYCLEAMNDVDFAVSTFGADMTYGIIGFAGDYGGDYAAGVKIAAEANGLGDPLFEFVQTSLAAGGTVDEAVGLILANSPSVVFLTTGPFELVSTLGGMVQNGGTSVFIGTHPTWNPALPAAAPDLVPALENLYFHSDWIPGWYGDSPGHVAAKAAADAEGQSPNAWYINGWASQYPVKAMIEQALTNGDITRAGVAAAVKQLNDVSFDGMIDNANYAGGAETAARASLINKVDATAPGGTVNLTPLAVGPTAAAYDFSGACFS